MKAWYERIDTGDFSVPVLASVAVEFEPDGQVYRLSAREAEIMAAFVRTFLGNDEHGNSPAARSIPHLAPHFATMLEDAAYTLKNQGPR